MTTESPTPTAPEAPAKSIDLFPWIVLASYTMLGIGFTKGILGSRYPQELLTLPQTVVITGITAAWPFVALHQVGQKLGETLKTP